MKLDVARAFRSDPLRHDGVRQINVRGLRLFYLLMLLFVAPTAWRTHVVGPRRAPVRTTAS